MFHACYRVLLFAVYCKLYFNSHSHSLQFGCAFRLYVKTKGISELQGVHYILVHYITLHFEHKISLRKIPI